MKICRSLIHRSNLLQLPCKTTEVESKTWNKQLGSPEHLLWHCHHHRDQNSPLHSSWVCATATLPKWAWQRHTDCHWPSAQEPRAPRGCWGFQHNSLPLVFSFTECPVLGLKGMQPSTSEWSATEGSISMITPWQPKFGSDIPTVKPDYHSQSPGAAGYSTQPHTMAEWLRNALSLRTKIPHTICVGKADRVRVLLLYSLQNKLQRKATENRTSNKNNTSDSSFLLVKKRPQRFQLLFDAQREEGILIMAWI